MTLRISRLLGAAAFLVAALFVSGEALAQQTPLQAGPWVPGHAPMYVGQTGFAPVLQDSGTAAGGALGAGLSELGLTVRGTGTPPFANAGVGQFQTNFCDYDGPTTGPYHFFCFSPNAQGGGLMAYGAAGGAATLPFAFNVNGTAYPFPFAIGGIVGPGSSTSGDIACWNNTAGTLLKDCGNAPLLGPGTTVVGNAALWNNTNGTLLKDAGFPPVQGPASATANDGTCFNGTSGTLLKDCGFPPVQGPASSTSANTACWNNASGTLLKDCGFPPFVTWGGTATGAVNAYAVNANLGGALAYAAPLKVLFVANGTNSGSATLAINAIAPAAIYKDTAGGPQLLVGGEIIAASLEEADFDPALGSGAGGFHLVSPQPGTFTSLASAATVAIGGARGDYIQITGTTTITSFDGVPAGVQRTLVFAGSLTLTNNANIILPAGGLNIATAAGDMALCRSEGSAVWRCAYSRASGAPPVLPPVAAGRLSFVSATQVKFVPYNGAAVQIAGVLYPIPGAGITAANTSVFVNGTGASSLAASTTYDVYLFNNAGVLTFDFSTTTHTTDTTAGNVGVEIENGNNSRTLIGMVRTNASSPGQFEADNSLWGVLSWFNRRDIAIATTFSADRSTSSATYVELNTEIRANFLTWGDEAVTVGMNGTVSNTSAQANATAVSAPDSTTAAQAGFETSFTSSTANQRGPVALAGAISGITEGFHFLAILGASSGTSTWNSSTTISSGSAKVGFNVKVRG